MLWNVLLLFQSAPAALPEASGFDLKKLEDPKALPRITDIIAACDRADESDIVVCGRRKGQGQRLEPLPELFEEPPVTAATGLPGGMSGNMHMEGVELPMGARTNRLMVTLTKPF